MTQNLNRNHHCNHCWCQEAFIPCLIHPAWLMDPSGPPQHSRAICVTALGFCGCHEFSAFPTVHTHQGSPDLATVISAACSHREKCLFYKPSSQTDLKQPASAPEPGTDPACCPTSAFKFSQLQKCRNSPACPDLTGCLVLVDCRQRKHACKFDLRDDERWGNCTLRRTAGSNCLPHCRPDVCFQRQELHKASLRVSQQVTGSSGFFCSSSPAKWSWVL